MITSKIIKDSINPSNKRITSFVTTYPRFLHGEVMTHRVFSRNAASSRAIPVKKIIESITNSPAFPEQWGKNMSGMQSKELLDIDAIEGCKDDWNDARDFVISVVEKLIERKLHKQVANRLLEPWFHMTTLITSTEWDNFYQLRAHPDAQPEFQVLAYRMLDQYLNNTPQPLEWGQWHIPFVDNSIEGGEEALVQSVASCARVSYTKQDGDFPFEKQKAIYDSLHQTPCHASPFEHQAQANQLSKSSGNYRGGWKQLRETIEPETAQQINLQQILDNKPDWVTLNS